MPKSVSFQRSKKLGEDYTPPKGKDKRSKGGAKLRTVAGGAEAISQMREGSKGADRYKEWEAQKEKDSRGKTRAKGESPMKQRTKLKGKLYAEHKNPTYKFTDEERANIRKVRDKYREKGTKSYDNPRGADWDKPKGKGMKKQSPMNQGVKRPYPPNATDEQKAAQDKREREANIRMIERRKQRKRFPKTDYIQQSPSKVAKEKGRLDKKTSKRSTIKPMSQVQMREEAKKASPMKHKNPKSGSVTDHRHKDSWLRRVRDNIRDDYYSGGDIRKRGRTKAEREGRYNPKQKKQIAKK